jgi:hypothetical protein
MVVLVLCHYMSSKPNVIFISSVLNIGFERIIVKVNVQRCWRRQNITIFPLGLYNNAVLTSNSFSIFFNSLRGGTVKIKMKCLCSFQLKYTKSNQY